MRARKFIPLFVVGAALLAYQNSFTGPFIYDDVASIVANPTIRHLWPIWDVLSPPRGGGLTVEGRQIINVSLAINYALGGTKVWGYHALNLIIHILVGLTLYGIVRRTLLLPRFRDRFGTSGDGLALAVALLWTIHPLQSEAVSYVIQRAELIMGLFYLLTLYCFIRAAESPRPGPWYGLCVTACALGMASKEVMATAPLVVILYDRTFLSGSFSKAWRRHWPVLLALAGTWIVLGYIMLAGNLGNAMANAKSFGVTWWEYALTEPGVIFHYLKLSVWPKTLCFNYDGWPIVRTWKSIPPQSFAIVILLGATAWALKKNSVWGFVGAWFFLILAPSSSFMPTDSPAYEHRVYLSLAAVVVLAVMGIHALAGRRTVAVAAALAIGLGFLTWQRNQVYRSEFIIWADTVAKRPNNPRAHNNIGKVLLDAGILPQAIEHFEQAIKLRSSYAVAHDNLGSAFAQTGKYEEAVQQFDLALQLQPGLGEAQFNMARALARLGRLPEAAGHYEQALRLNPDDAEAHSELGNTLLALGKVPEAVQHWEQAVQIKPDYVEPRNNLAVALAQAGRIPEAVEQFRQVVRIAPDDAEARYNLGSALAASGNTHEAMAQYKQALQIHPVYPDAQDSLARLFATLPPAKGGNPTQAVVLAEAACSITSNQVAPYLDTLALTYAAAGRFDEAVATAEKALDLARAAGQTQLAEQIQRQLEMYRGERRYRELRTRAQSPPGNVTSPPLNP